MTIILFFVLFCIFHIFYKEYTISEKNDVALHWYLPCLETILLILFFNHRNLWKSSKNFGNLPQKTASYTNKQQILHEICRPIKVHSRTLGKKKKKNCVQILKLFLMHYINRSSPKLDNRIATIFVMLKMSKLSVRRLRTHSS